MIVESVDFTCRSCTSSCSCGGQFTWHVHGDDHPELDAPFCSCCGCDDDLAEVDRTPASASP